MKLYHLSFLVILANAVLVKAAEFIGEKENEIKSTDSVSGLEHLSSETDLTEPLSHEVKLTDVKDKSGAGHLSNLFTAVESLNSFVEKECSDEFMAAKITALKSKIDVYASSVSTGLASGLFSEETVETESNRMADMIDFIDEYLKETQSIQK